MPKSTPQYDIIPIETIIRKHNGYWFSEDSKRFFKSRWENTAYQNEGSLYAYFISSEQHDANLRKYTIRRVNMRDGEFSTGYPTPVIFEFQQYTTKAHALKALHEYLKTEDIKGELIAWLKGELEHTIPHETSSTQQRKQETQTELTTLQGEQ